MSTIYKIPLMLEPQPEGGYTVTSASLPELVTEGDTVAEALHHVENALAAVLELYEERGKPLPGGVQRQPEPSTIALDYPIVIPEPTGRSRGSCDGLDARR
jgi:antitoxin HicB